VLWLLLLFSADI